MTLVARVTFLVLVGATFSAFFVAQRLKSTPPVIDVSRSRAFSPNGDGSATKNDISIGCGCADDATVDVVNLDGDRVKRLAENVRDAARAARCGCVGRQRRRGRAACPRQYRLRVSLRDEGRSATVQKTTTVDTKAPPSQVCIGFKCSDPQKRMGNVISQGDRAVRSTSAASRASDAVRCCAPTRASRARSRRFELAGRRNRAEWNGLVDGKPLRPGPTSCRRGCATRPGNIGVTPAEFEVGAIPGRPGLTVRGLAAQPPLRPVTAGQRVEFGVDARGRSTAGACAGWATRRCASAVRRPSRCSRSARHGAVGRLPARAALRAAGTRRCRSSCRPRSARACSWSCRR